MVFTTKFGQQSGKCCRNMTHSDSTLEALNVVLVANCIKRDFKHMSIRTRAAQIRSRWLKRACNESCH